MLSNERMMQHALDGSIRYRRRSRSQLFSKLSVMLEDAKFDVPPAWDFSQANRKQFSLSNALERFNAGIKRCIDRVGIFRDAPAIGRPIGGLLLAQNDEWSWQTSHATRKTHERRRRPDSLNLGRRKKTGIDFPPCGVMHHAWARSCAHGCSVSLSTRAIQV